MLLFIPFRIHCSLQKPYYVCLRGGYCGGGDTMNVAASQFFHTTFFFRLRSTEIMNVIFKVIHQKV